MNLTNDNLTATPTIATVTDDGSVVIPLAAETLLVDKQEVVTGGVRVSKTIIETSQIVDEALRRQDVTVTRVPINEFVTTAPQIRHEGNTMIVPVLEEVLVVEKRLRLREEIHLTRHSSEYHDPQTVVIRAEEAHVERWTAGETENPVETAL